MSANAQAVKIRRWRDSDHFRSHVVEWADRIRVRPKSVHLRAMKNKWASCSTRGLVSFSTDLLAKDAAFGEYVIVHELLHLKIPNHGKLFKSLLKAYLPEWSGSEDNKVTCGISNPSGSASSGGASRRMEALTH